MTGTLAETNWHAGNAGQGPTEIAPGRLYRLGGSAVLDGRISWAPRDATGHQPISCYLVLNDAQATLIDTGVVAHRDQVMSQLKQILPPNMPLNVFLTRSEYETSGNVGPVHGAFGVRQLYAGGTGNFFDGYNEVAGFAAKWDQRVQLARILPGDGVALDASKRLTVLTAPIRVLTTYWLFDSETGTLFTSDLFGHTALNDPSDSLFIDDRSMDSSTRASVARHVYCKFAWIADARIDQVVANLERIFEDREVKMIAPSHGCMLRGRETVQRHYEFMRDILRERISAAPAARS